jgi:hypothetical protein
MTASACTVAYRFVVMMVPGLRSCMLWGDSSKWRHVADAVRNGQVWKQTMQ